LSTRSCRNLVACDPSTVRKRISTHEGPTCQFLFSPQTLYFFKGPAESILF
jgi:hypothetical protein